MSDNIPTGQWSDYNKLLTAMISILAVSDESDISQTSKPDGSVKPNPSGSDIVYVLIQ